MQSYIVQEGDTLYGISSQFGVSVNDIKLQNNLGSNNVVVGETLMIPTIGTTVLYTVENGDNLYSIATKYNVTVSELMKINGLTNEFLSIGQQLRIPVNSGSSKYDYYTVTNGDNLYSIAAKFNTSVDTLMSINNLTSNKLSIGQELKIPVTVANYSDDYLYYVVKAGDNLYSISNKFGMSVDELKKINNLENNNLSIGEVLKINQNYNSNISIGDFCYGEGYVPVNYVTYVVKSTDNLYKIAKMFNTSVENLKLLNNLDSNNLSIGQILKIREES
jgi:LysM repeat protein